MWLSYLSSYLWGWTGQKNHPVFVYIVNIVTLIVILATEMRGVGGLYPNLLIILRWISQISNQMLLPRNVEKLSKLNLTHCSGFCGLLPKQWRIGRPTGTVDYLTNVNKLGAVADRIISEYEYQHNLFTNKKLFLAICQIYFWNIFSYLEIVVHIRQFSCFLNGREVSQDVSLSQLLCKLCRSPDRGSWIKIKAKHKDEE